MSQNEITSTGLKDRNPSSVPIATPKKRNSTEDLLEAVSGVRLYDDDNEKTPTGLYNKISPGESSSEGAPTPTPAISQLAVPSSNLPRKSASSLTLRASDADDVFAPAPKLTAALPAQVNTAAPAQVTTVVTAQVVPPTETIADRIRRGELSLVTHYPRFQPRQDRGRQANSQNAQGLLPPDALVFAANLSDHRTKEQLELTCHQVFDIFGNVHIKVKYDKHKHPFALLQFETAEAAQEAISCSVGTVLDGRPIRLEQGKAERAIIVTKVDGSYISETEARDLMKPFGAIEAIFPTSALRGRASGLQGWYIRFAFYDDCRDALKGLADMSSTFRIQYATGQEQDIRPSSIVAAVGSHLPPRSGASGIATDSKSVFIGNLPTGTSKQDLVNIFCEHGYIVDCNVISKTYQGGSINVFGFVEYATPEQADAAAYTDKYLAGNKLRVEPKEYTARRGQRIGGGASAIYTPPARTPRHSPPRHTPRRITPQANNALSARLAANNVANFGSIYTPGPTPPEHLLPAGLFTPSPPFNYGPMGDQYGYHYEAYGMGGGYGGI